jgi:hypothetical protein
MPNPAKIRVIYFLWTALGFLLGLLFATFIKWRRKIHVVKEEPFA